MSTCATSGHAHGSAVARPVAVRGHLFTRAAWNRLCALRTRYQQDPDRLKRARAGARALAALAGADRPSGTVGAAPRAAPHPSSRKDAQGRMNEMQTVAQHPGQVRARMARG
jgi:hypothetical protein